MCDICSDVLELLESHDARIGDKGGLQLNKMEILAVVLYVQLWPQQRQCMCCYNDYKNFDRFNNLVQLILARAINFIDTLPRDCRRAALRSNLRSSSHLDERARDQEDRKSDDADSEERDVDVTSIEVEQKEIEKSNEPSEHIPLDYESSVKSKETSADPQKSPDVQALEVVSGDSPNEIDVWTLEEKDRLFQFVSKMFLMNFPLYLAYKHRIHTSLEELSKQDANALNNYCELSDPEIPIYLLRNVCYFCDSNGIQALAQCFKESDPVILPCSIAHTLITICANVRLWMNYRTSVRYVGQIRSHVIRYMCSFSEKDLRMAATRNMTDLMWQALKEPRETTVTFDREGLDLAFKYFTCSMLTLRLAGIAQINSQINTYTELAQSEALMDNSESVGWSLAEWLIDNKIVEQIFGPNLHVEIIKQSQIILNFLALECRLTTDHIDVIWAASQLKHCGKQVLDILAMMVKQLEQLPIQHLHSLMHQLDPSAHTEQTLMLASAVTKFIWISASSRNQQQSLANVAAARHQGNQHLYCTVITRGQEEGDGTGEILKDSHYSSSRSESEGSSGNETEEGEVKMKTRHLVLQHRQAHRVPKEWVNRPRSSSTEGQRSEGQRSEEDSNCSSNASSTRHLPASVRKMAKDMAKMPSKNLRLRIIPQKRGKKKVPLRGAVPVVSPRQAIMRKKAGRVPVSIGKVIMRKIHPGPGMVVPCHRHYHHPHRRPHESESEEEEEDEEEEDEEDYSDSEGEVAKHMKVMPGMQHRAGMNVDEDEEEDDEDEEEEESSDNSSAESDGYLKNARLCRGVDIRGTKRVVTKMVAPIVVNRKSDRRRTTSSPTGSRSDGDEVEKKRSRLSDEDPVKSEGQLRSIHFVKESEHGSNLHDTIYKSNDQEILELEEPLNTSEEAIMLPEMSGCHSSGCDDDAVTMVTNEMLYDAFAGKSGGLLLDQKQISVEDIHNCLEPTIQPGLIRQKRGTSDNMEDIDSPEEGSNSSRFTNKSEKNMSDFEGEDALSDELAQINAHSHFGGLQPMPQQLTKMVIYHSQLPDGVFQGPMKGDASKHSDMMMANIIKLDEICQPGNTLIWDLLQDHNIEKLPEGLINEAEKILYSLVCCATDKPMRTKFVEACIENLTQNRSVVISLRLLPKILSSFHQIRSAPDTHTVTMWAEHELHMMKHFFNNLAYYTNAVRQGIKLPHSLYSFKEEIQTRLNFLTCIFSSNGSPENFRLSMGQVDALWNCLAMDPQCSDDCLNWFYSQTKNKEYHAFGIETLKHIFIEKMPQLKPEDTSMIGLNLFTQLCHLARVAAVSVDSSVGEEQIYGIDQLWGIALRAQNTDVSLTAINVLNHHYISYGSGALEKEESFVQKCMESLSAASSNLDTSPESSLLIIQRGLILLTNHLESFRKRYAYHLRHWQLSSEWINNHQHSVQEKHSQVIHVNLQSAGANEKTIIEMSSTDLVAELRAEVTYWWEVVHQQQQKMQKEEQAAGASTGSVLMPILGAMLGDGPVRMITLGQELSMEVDEKTLAEMQFKDLQLVFVSQSASRGPKKQDGSMPPCPSPPPRSKLPMMLLIKEPHFSCLFNLLQQLSSFCPNNSLTDLQEQFSLQTKARVLSRKVWDLLMLLPTNPHMLDGFKNIVSNVNEEESGGSSGTQWEELLDPVNPHRLMYSLQIIESLSRRPKFRRRAYNNVPMSTAGSGSESSGQQSSNTDHPPNGSWSQKFIDCGGLKHLFSIFLSGRLQVAEGEHHDEWLQDCLAYLLRLITQFAIPHGDMETNQSDPTCVMHESPLKKIHKKKAADEKPVVPRLNKRIMSMMEVETIVKMLMQIMYESAIPCRDFNQWPSTSWGHVEVIHYAMSFLVSLAYTCEAVQPIICSSNNFSSWLKRLTLEAPEPPVRQEACQGLYKLCLCRSCDGVTGYPYLLPVLANLLPHLDEVHSMKASKKASPFSGICYKSQEEKEPYGPGCRDYFWLLCHLVDGIRKDDAESSWEQEGSQLDLNVVIQLVAEHITSRGFFEKRQNTAEDDVLVGLLRLASSLVKHNPPFKSSEGGQKFLVEVFRCLFALPSPKMRFLPKCKTQNSRTGAYDLMVELVKGNVENYTILHGMVMLQHHKDSHLPYSWDTWPHEEERSKCGYVGLTNLGATCYMATCMQHLYMIPEARKSVLEARCSDDTRHEGTLFELKKMFAYLLESERKAYNPYSFCKVYMMDHQPLNTGEQKDMTEFFTDLITKLEEMGPDLKRSVKMLFGGVITNNVVSLDCPHVSRTKEEFYTVRCQVADMKNLYESLDEVTVKDMLEGDNMYTCSKCQRKVRAEKRACFKRLPSILCFNTMRYTFNMVTMTKEKVNTHFSFPMRLDMSSYMEKNLIRKQFQQVDDFEKSDNGEDSGSDAGSEDADSYEYELIGVTVHTGTADGGHYYSFIRDRINKNELGHDRWYLFNDAEVKPFDSAQLASECFGGEMTSKTYDSVNDKFMDFSFEKTHSAYMLFYERIARDKSSAPTDVACTYATQDSSVDKTSQASNNPVSRTDGEDDDLGKFKIELSPDLAEWIWQDNMQFLQDKNIFEHQYFSFMWQMCGYLPSTLPRNDPEQKVSLMAAKLSASFILETLIHSKEKPTMLQWIEIATKLFNADRRCCEWFLDTMAEDDWWPQQILIKCPNQTIRQMFQRLVIHVINQLKPVHAEWYCHPSVVGDSGIPVSAIGNGSCVTRFIKRMLAIIEQDSRPHCKFLSEYFGLLIEFARMGDNESQFLLQINAISSLVSFFMGHKQQDNYLMQSERFGRSENKADMSDDEEREIEDIINLTDDRYCPQSLEKMIALVALLVEKSRCPDEKTLNLSEKDEHAIIGGKGFPFLYHQIKDAVNLRHTCNLIFSLTRFREPLAISIVQMIFGAITRSGAETQAFFKLLSLLTEFMVGGGPPGLPPFLHYILQKFWDVAQFCPQHALEWLSTQVVRYRGAGAWALDTLDQWVEPYLMGYNNVRVRNAAAYLLVTLVPNSNFRQSFRTNRNLLSPHKDNIVLNEESIEALHLIYNHLLKLLSKARQYADGQGHGTSKLVSYFSVLNYCLVSRSEKLMFSRYFNDLWQLFQPKLSEPPIAVHHNKQVLHRNKQAMLLFWHQVCTDCPENIKLIVNNPSITKNIAFNYILADHEDQEVILINRSMLPAYYGILRMCCLQSQPFTRQLAQHQNIKWAFKNITPHPTQYTAAVEELFWLMKLMVRVTQDTTEEDLKAIAQFRRNTLLLYLQDLDARTHWQTLVTALKILLESHEDRLFVLQHNGLVMLHEAFNTLHLMHHEATACHVTDDIVMLLTIMQQTLATARKYIAEKKAVEVKPHLSAWKDRYEFVRKLLTLLNSYTSFDIRQATFECLREMVLTYQNECIQSIVPVLVQAHSTFQEHNGPISMGPYFPKLGQKSVVHKSSIRPPRPQFQMFLHSNQLESTKGLDLAYDSALHDFYDPYHHFVDLLVRVAVNQQNVPESIVILSAMVAYEGVPLHMPYFAKLWYEIYQTEHVDRKCIAMLCNCASLIEYVIAVLVEERSSLNNIHIYQFFCNYFPKVYQQVLSDQGHSMMDNLLSSVETNRGVLESINSSKDLDQLWSSINGDLRAMQIVFSLQLPNQIPSSLVESLRSYQQFGRGLQLQRQAAIRQQKKKSDTEVEMPDDGSSDASSKQDEAAKGDAKGENASLESKETSKGKVPAKRRRLSSKGDSEDLTASPTKAVPAKKDKPKCTGVKRGLDEGDVPSCSKDVSSTSSARSKTPEDDSSSEQVTDTAAVCEPAQGQKNVAAQTKEKPAMLDLVIKNIEAVFRLLQQKH